MKNRLLLHSCCAPCSTSVLERLSRDYDITLFFYNPNILPEAEYIKRLNEQARFLSEVYSGIDLIRGDYEPEAFKRAIAGLEHIREGGERCFKCYELRLGRTAEVAKQGGYDLFCTTLTVSPRKNAGKINEISRNISEKYRIDALYADFKKKDGYKRSSELSKKHNLYRQDYCGCGYDS